MMKKLALALLSGCLATGTQAQNLEDVASLSMLSGWRATDGSHIAALRIDLAPGWKTYWRAPGDGGIPMQLTLAGSTNLNAAQLHWPVPDVFYQSGIRSIGYADSVVIPITINPDDSASQIQVSGQVTIGVCEEICIPMEFDIDHILPVKGKRDGTIVAALVDRPETAEEAGVTSVTCTLSPSNSAMTLTTTVSLSDLRGDEELAIETADPMIWVSEPDVSVSGDQITAVSDLVHMQSDTFALDRSGVRITIFSESRAIDVKGCNAG